MSTTSREHDGEPQGTSPRLALNGIGKRFGDVTALRDVDLAVSEGEIHALLGENGAGKSTLVKIIYGVLAADAGTMRFAGQPWHPASPHAARRARIGMVFQHFSLFDALSVQENIALGLEERMTRRNLARRVREVAERYGLPLEPDAIVHELSVGERQRIEIVRCLLQEPRLLIMDEPTSVLTPQEVERLFATLRELRNGGCSILYISHKLGEVQALCDVATILRNGEVVARCDPSATSAGEMAQLMVGRRLSAPRRAAKRLRRASRLVVRDLRLPADDMGSAVQIDGFDVRRGEIFGIAGVAGNGQGTLMAALTGERLAPRPEAITFEGQAIGHQRPAARRALGLCAIPEERVGHATVGTLTLCENAFLSAYVRAELVEKQLSVIDRPARDHFTRAVVQRFDVRTSGIGARASSLSGGNLQKFCVGREVLQEPSLLIAAQPTWGVDAAAAAAIHKSLAELASGGASLLIISQDLDELLLLSDRMAVMNAGRLSRPFDTGSASIEQIGLLMGGLHDLEERQAADAA